MVVQSLKGRRVEAILPSEKDKERWMGLADKAGIPLSKYIYEMVENAQDDKKEVSPDIAGELQALREENKVLREDNRLKSMIIEKLENENYKLRFKEFTNTSFEGTRSHHEELTSLLKQGRPMSSENILAALGVDHQDVVVIKALYSQLETLREYGLAEETARGWRWVG